MEETALQSLSHLWIEERSKRLTASNFGLICKKMPHTNCDNIVKKILYNNFESNGMKYGRNNEKNAIEELNKIKIKVNPCGLFIDEELPFLAATPDGLLDDDGTVEIKCPSSCVDLTPEEGIMKKKITFWYTDKKSNKIEINKTHVFYYQIQGQLHIAKREYCLFVLWTPRGIKTERIERDEDFWVQNMEHRLKKFYFDCLLPELIDPRYPRSLPIRNPHYIIEAQKQRQEKKQKNIIKKCKIMGTAHENNLATTPPPLSQAETDAIA